MEKKNINISHKDYIELYNKFNKAIHNVVYPEPHKQFSDQWYDYIYRLIEYKKRIDRCDVEKSG